MKEIIGNFETEMYSGRYDAICCTTNTTLKSNGELVMGAGIAKILKEKFAKLPFIWGERIRLGKHVYGMMVTKATSIGSVLDLYIIAFPTKNHWKDNSDIQLIVRSAKNLQKVADFLGLENILLPRPGCQNGGLNWSDVQPEISFLDNRVIIISKD